MIETFFCNREDKIYEKVNQYINKNLQEMVECYSDYALDDNELYNIFPAYRYDEGSDFGKKTLNELYQLIKSRVERSTIKPKYEYLLMYIIDYYLDLQEDDEEFRFSEIDDELRVEIELYDKENEVDEDYIPLMKEIKNLDSYVNNCFWDWDFLPDNVDSMANIYIQNINNRKYHEDFYQLDEYIDLMAPDLREKYIEIRNMGKKVEDNRTSVEKNVITKIYTALRLLEQSILEIFEDSEVEISNQIYRMIYLDFKTSLNIEVNREKPIGRALSNLGEADLFFINMNLIIKI